MFNIIGAIFSGLIIGALARYFYPGAVAMGWGMTILLGIAGSLLAGLVTTRGKTGDGFHRAGCLASIVGAMLLIFIGRHFGWHF
ncbi:MAG: GlsB/YeaQ/YmgE family stress response membrane protein [Novosphingobium sp.]